MKSTRCVVFFLIIAAWIAFHGTALAFNGLLPISSRPSAKEFALKDPEGRLHTLSQYRGQVVLVNFWATWCPPCLKEMPSMERLWKELGGKGLVILAVNIGESAEDVEYFGFSHNLTFPLLLDQNDSISRAWLVRGLPTSYVINLQGEIVYQAIGERDWDDPNLKKAITELLQENKKP